MNGTFQIRVFDKIFNVHDKQYHNLEIYASKATQFKILICPIDT